MKELHESQEILDVVDENDNVIGSATRGEIHERGMIHRAVHIFVFDTIGRMYVQRRSPQKDRFPGKLDSSAAGHVDSGETYKRAAIRELGEELGLEADLERILKVQASKVTDNEHVVLYSANSASAPRPNSREISWGGFMELDELKRSMEENAQDYVPAFRFLMERYLEMKP
jgi:isopentenyl-diphosphate delta-isomerase type 1